MRDDGGEEGGWEAPTILRLSVNYWKCKSRRLGGHGGEWTAASVCRSILTAILEHGFLWMIVLFDGNAVVLVNMIV